MKKLLAFICLCIQIVPIMGQSVLRTSQIKVETKLPVGTGVLSSSIIRVKSILLGKRRKNSRYLLRCNQKR